MKLKLCGKRKEVEKFAKLGKIGTAGAVASAIIAVGTVIWVSNKLKAGKDQNDKNLELLKAKNEELTALTETIKQFSEKRKDEVGVVNGTITNKLKEYNSTIKDAEEILNIVDACGANDIYTAFTDLEDKLAVLRHVTEQVAEVLSDESISKKERYAQAITMLRDMELSDDEIDEEEEDDDEGIDD